MAGRSLRRVALTVALVVGAGSAGPAVAVAGEGSPPHPGDVSGEAFGSPGSIETVLLRGASDLGRVGGERQTGETPHQERSGSSYGPPDPALPVFAAMVVDASPQSPVMLRRHAIVLRGPPASRLVDIT